MTTSSCTFTNTEQGTINIVKATVGADGTFDFVDATVGGPLDDFTIDTAVIATKTFEDVVPGAYTIRETVPATGWDLTNIVCSSTATPASTFSYAGATASPTAGFEPGDNRATITLAPGDDTVSCTFTNTERGTIDITKTTVGGSGEFAFTENTTGSPVGFDLTTPGAAATKNLAEVPGTLPGADAYTVTETVPVGWDLTGIACTSTGGSTFTYTGFNADPAFQLGDTSANITLAAGDETVSCDFINTKRGTINIVKAIDGGDGTFAFTDNTIGTPLGNFSIDTATAVDDTKTFTNVLPGTYTITETAQTGWDLTGLTCADTGTASTVDLGTGIATINVDPGETVTCTYTNTKRGTIVIVEDTTPEDLADFGFTENITPITGGTFTLDDDGSTAGGGDDVALTTKTFSNVVPGTYTVTENDPTPAFDLTGLTCVDSDTGGTDSVIDLGDRESTINLDPGETVTCTYTNTKRGTIVIVEDTTPEDLADFGFTENITPITGGTFTLDDDGSTAGGGDDVALTTKTFSNVVPGTYTVTENDPTPAFDLTGLTCVDSDTGGTDSVIDLGDRESTINLDPGETVTCTYTNTKRGTIVIVEDTTPEDLADFGFAENITPITGGTFTLDDDGSTAGGGDDVALTTKTFSNVVPGTYTVDRERPDTCVRPDRPDLRRLRHRRNRLGHRPGRP